MVVGFEFLLVRLPVAALPLLLAGTRELLFDLRRRLGTALTLLPLVDVPQVLLLLFCLRVYLRFRVRLGATGAAFGPSPRGGFPLTPSGGLFLCFH